MRSKNMSETAHPTVKAGITRAVTKSRKTGDWLALENILPNTALGKKAGAERIYNHILKIRNPDFKINGIGNNTQQTVIVIGQQKQITRTINPTPQPYQTHLGITQYTDRIGYKPLTGIDRIAWTGPTITPTGHITHPTPIKQTTNKTPTKPTTQPLRKKRLSSVYSPLSRNRGKGIRKPRGSLRDIANRELGRKV